MTTPLAHTKTDAARALGVCPATVRRMVRRGQLATVRVCDRDLIPASEIQRITTPERAVPVRPLTRLEILEQFRNS